MKIKFFCAICAFLLLLQISNLYAQKKVKALALEKIIYTIVVNGNEVPEEGNPILLCYDSTEKIFTQKQAGKKYRENLPEEAGYIDFKNGKTWQVATLDNGSRFHIAGLLQDAVKFTPTGEEEIILGYKCTKVKAVVFSNTIEIWFTKDAGIQGSPSLRYTIPGALILKISRNGNNEIIATKMEILKGKNNPIPLLLEDWGEKVDASVYRNKLTNSYVRMITVFDREHLSWGNEINNPADIQCGKTFHFAGGTFILRKISLPKVTEDYQLFAKLTQYSNGDAYDRTGSVFVIPVSAKRTFLDGLFNGVKQLPEYYDKKGKVYQGVVATDDYQPPLELMRFFTSFGIRQYNDKVKVDGIKWADSVTFKQELSELLPVLQGDVYIGAWIGNYDKGGHILSLNLEYYPNSEEVMENTANKFWVCPIFNTVNILEMAGQEYGTMFSKDSLKVDFEIPEGVKNLHLRYISTGHGGWENGDEFNQKTNIILVDGQEVFSYIPWRCDCASFRNFNPASGNFWNGLSSSDFSRSGWCPGTLTIPVEIPLNLSPGKHKLQVAIPMGEPEGGSFSAWNVSGVLIGEK